MPLARCARWVIRTAQRPRVLEALSWLVWLATVALFALWTHAHYRTPAGPSWIGMTVRTGVFATWAQVAREWAMIRIHGRQSRQSQRKRAQQQVYDD